MLQAHKDNNASLTVAVLDVPLKEASRFGIMNTDANNRIVEFEEKPAEPKSTKASMGGFTSLTGLVCAICWLLLKKSDIDMSDFGKKCHSNLSRIKAKVFMLMNSMVVERRWYDLSLFGKPIWNISIRIMLWIVAIVTENLFTQPHFSTELLWGTCPSKILLSSTVVR